MLATAAFRGTAIDCRARSSATARDRIGSQRHRSRRIRRAATLRVAPAAVVLAAAVLAAAVVRGAVVLRELRGAVVGRHNEAKPICGPGFDPKMMMKRGNDGPQIEEKVEGATFDRE